jgi:hypothetical protein
MVAWPIVLSVGLPILAEPIWKPPELTLAVLWQPPPLQSSAPIGIWFPGVVVIVMLANVPATAGAWQLRQAVAPIWVPVTE